VAAAVGGGTIAAVSALGVFLVGAVGLFLKARQAPAEAESANVTQLSAIVDAMQVLIDQLRQSLARSENETVKSEARAETARVEALAKIEQLEEIIAALRANIVILEAKAVA
jgi:hypothetical protein